MKAARQNPYESCTCGHYRLTHAQGNGPCLFGIMKADKGKDCPCPKFSAPKTPGPFTLTEDRQ